MLLTVLKILNLVTALVTSLGGVVALIRPEQLIKGSPIGPGGSFYAKLYAARAIPFGIVAGLLPYFCHGPVVPIVLILAAVIQAGDIAIGVQLKIPRVILGASAATLTHLFCALALL
jgi:hypothetical protein